MKNKGKIFSGGSIFLTGLTGLLCLSAANAALVINVDFEDGSDNFTKDIEDPVPTDGITVNTTSANINNWTVTSAGAGIGAGNIREDGNANAVATTPPKAARFEGGTRTYSIVLDVASGQAYDFTGVSFDIWGATGGSSGGSGRSANFGITTSNGFVELWSNSNLPGRNFGKDLQDIDLTALGNASDYANIEDGQITFSWTVFGASDMDTIEIFANPTAAPIPEPSSAVLLGLGSFALLLRRRK